MRTLTMHLRCVKNECKFELSRSAYDAYDVDFKIHTRALTTGPRCMEHNVDFIMQMRALTIRLRCMMWAFSINGNASPHDGPKMLDELCRLSSASF